MSFHAVVPAPFTMLNGVKKLQPASIAVFEADGRRKDHVYWTLSFAREAADLEASAANWEGQVRAALDNAEASRLVHAVPVGVLQIGRAAWRGRVWQEVY